MADFSPVGHRSCYGIRRDPRRVPSGRRDSRHGFRQKAGSAGAPKWRESVATHNSASVSMYYLVPTSATRSAIDLCSHPDAGWIMTRASSKPSLLRKTGCVWAADNGCWSRGDDFDLTTYLSWLKAMQPFGATCLFATAPDVVGRALDTWERSRNVLPQIRHLGYQAALVAQDGIENLSVPWAAFDALFVGGTTRWKLSEASYELVRVARNQGKWVHMGRVNTGRRFRAAMLAGCDSVDGTCVIYGPDRNAPIVRGWLDGQRESPALPGW